MRNRVGTQHQCWENTSGEVVPSNELPEQPIYFLQNCRAHSLNHKRKISQCVISCMIQISIHVQCQPHVAHGHTIKQYFSQDLVIYEPPLQQSTKSAYLIFEDDASRILISHLVVFTTCHFPHVGQQTHFNNYINFCSPSTYFNKQGMFYYKMFYS